MSEIIQLKPIELVHRIYVVDSKGNIGHDVTGNYQYYGSILCYQLDYSWAIVIDGANYAGLGLGKVNFVNIEEPVIIDGARYHWIAGRLYKTVIMPDGKEWMAENLDFKLEGLTLYDGAAYWNATSISAYYPNYDEETYGFNGMKYGLLYYKNVYDKMQGKTIDYFPGWHVPDRNEWIALMNSLGGVPGKKLKSTSGWADYTSSGQTHNGNGTDDYGFNLKPAGSVDNGSAPSNLGYEAAFYTRYVNSSSQFDFIWFKNNSDNYTNDYNSYRRSGSVRLVKNT